MLLEELIDRFAEKAPVAAMARALLAHVLAAEELDRLFREHSQRQFENELLFSSVVELLSLVVTKSHKSLHAAYRVHHAELNVSLTAFYDKLAGMELPVIRALVKETAGRMQRLAEQLEPQRPSLIAGYKVRIVDGSHLAASHRRIKETRNQRGAPLPGHSLVILDPARQLILDMLPCADGHAQERTLLPELAYELQPGQLWICDRNFSTVMWLHKIAASSAAFIIRRHGNMPLELEGSARPLGRVETGQLFEQIGYVPDSSGNRLRVRVIRIILDTPTESGEDEIVLLTNLPQEIEAGVVANAYRKRWTIEAAFGEITLSLRGEIDTLGYPGAALLGYAIALLIYNVLSTVKTTIRVVHGTETAEQMSTYYFADEISSTWRGIDIFLPQDAWRKRFAECDAPTLAERLRAMATRIRPQRYCKNPRGTKKPPPQRIGKGPHVSTAKLLSKRNE